MSTEPQDERGLWLPAVMQEPVNNVISTDPDGFSIVLCHCDDGPYIGARKAGTPCCCERCGFMVREQWEALAIPAWAAVSDLAERLARGLFDLDEHMWKGSPHWDSLRPHYIHRAERFLIPRLRATPSPTARAGTDEQEA